jgi:hypothetical protein
VGRREETVDPGAGPVQRFAHELRELRRRAGSPSYRSMAVVAHYAATTLSVAASGRVLPSLAVTLAYVRACGGEPAEWQARWEAVAAADRPAEPPSPVPAEPPSPALAEPPVPAEPPSPVLRWRVRWAAAVLVGLTALSMAGAATGLVDRTGASPFPTASAEPAPARAIVNATIGADCPSTVGQVSVHTASSPAWSVGTLGGWTGDRCFGEYYFETPPGNDAIAGNRVEWTMPALPVMPMDCLVSIFVPNTAHASGSAEYEVSDRPDHTIDTQIVSQEGHRGDWVGTGPYRLSAGWLRLVMRSHGPAGAPVTAAAIHVYCVPPGEL